MHQINVLILGPRSFIATIIELKPYLKFNLYEGFSNTSLLDNFDVAIIHKYVLIIFNKEEKANVIDWTKLA
jgi:hypothetical protein